MRDPKLVGNMKWLALIAAFLAALFAIQILIADLRRGHKRSTLVQLALALLSLAVLGAAIYAAHLLGLFSLPVVAFLFVPFGLALRWSVLATRDLRRRREAAMPQIPHSRNDLVLGVAMWPFFLFWSPW